eukprot:8978638-Pyramimonas_sp.AAC.1
MRDRTRGHTGNPAVHCGEIALRHTGNPTMHGCKPRSRARVCCGANKRARHGHGIREEVPTGRIELSSDEAA